MKNVSEMTMVPVSDLIPYVNNARTHSPEQVMKIRSSLREFGFIKGWIVKPDESDQRVMVAYCICLSEYN